MIQLEILGSRNRGRLHTLSLFPVTVGRGTDCGLTGSGNGLKDRHFQIDLNPDSGFEVSAVQGVVSINGAIGDHVRLRNGDFIKAGDASYRFWLSPVEAPDHEYREQAVWTGIFLMGLLQVFLIFALLWR